MHPGFQQLRFTLPTTTPQQAAIGRIDDGINLQGRDIRLDHRYHKHTMDPLLGLILFGALLWLWHDNLRARELAITSARRMCDSAGVQLLDATVVLNWWGIKRRGMRLVLCRLYYFDYTDSGVDRRRGVVTLIGQQLDAVQQLPHTDPTPMD